jgi:hypothetical protein
MDKHMQIAQLLATHIEGCNPTNNKFTLLCGVDENKHLLKRDWFGYTKSYDIEYPFIYRRGNIYLGGEESYYECTNIELRELKVGEYFTITSSPEAQEQWECTYIITDFTTLAR